MVIKNLRKEIGGELKKARMQKGWSTEELSKKCGVPRSSISLIENGVWSVSLDKLEQICRPLGVNIIIEQARGHSRNCK